MTGERARRPWSSPGRWRMRPSRLSADRLGIPPALRRRVKQQTVRYFCDLGRTDPFAYLFQLYNGSH